MRCKALGHGVQTCSSTGSRAPPLPPPLSGTQPRCGRKARYGEGPPTLAVPPFLPMHTGLAYVFGSVRRTDGLADFLRMLQVASVTLDLIDSDLEEQDIAGGAVWSLPRHQLQRGSLHFVVARPPSSTFAPPFRDPQHVCGIPKSTARTRGLHPSRRVHVYRQSVGGTNRRGVQHCAFMGEVFFVLQRRSCLGSRSLIGLAPHASSWHVLEPNVPTSGYHQLVYRSLGPPSRPAFEGAQSHDPSSARSQPRSRVTRWSATATGTPHVSEWSSCGAPPLPFIPPPLTPVLQQLSPATCAGSLPLVAQRLWDLARQGCRTSSCSGSRPTLPR